VLFASEHEGYAVIKEEFEELWDEIKTKTIPGDGLSQIRHTVNCQKLKELIQVVAMCYKFFSSCVDVKTADSVFLNYGVKIHYESKTNKKKR
jgi:hypothetical protein